MGLADRGLEVDFWWEKGNSAALCARSIHLTKTFEVYLVAIPFGDIHSGSLGWP